MRTRSAVLWQLLSGMENYLRTGSGAGETVLPSDCIGIVKACKEVAKCFSATEEHYAKQADQARKYADTEKHMWRKYWDRSYKHYEKGLTEKERELAYGNEQAAYRGEELNLSTHDPFVIKTYNGPGTGICSVDYALNGHLDMNDALNQIFKENGIVIPDDVDLKPACNPANYGMPSPPQYEEGDFWPPDRQKVWDSIPDRNLSVGYKQGSLYDLETSNGYGPGQTAWIDQKRAAYQAQRKNYMEERALIIAQEAGKPNKYERLMLRMGAPEEVAKLDKRFYSMRKTPVRGQFPV